MDNYNHGRSFLCLGLLFFSYVTTSNAEQASFDGFGAAEFYGQSWGSAALGPQRLGGPLNTYKQSYRFEATSSSAPVKFLWENQNGTGGTSSFYHAGDLVPVTFEIKGDDGFGFPDENGPSFGIAKRDNLLSDPSFLPVFFSNTSALTAGNIYHIVLTNTSPDPVNNFVSTNHLWLQHAESEVDTPASGTGGGNDQYAATDMQWGLTYFGEGYNGSSTGDGDLRWHNREDYIISKDWDYRTARNTPIGEICLANGDCMGQGYINGLSHEATQYKHQQHVQGSEMVRQVFTPQDTLDVNSVALHGWRDGNPSGPLTYTLKECSGAVLATGSMPASEFDEPIIWHNGSAPSNPTWGEAQMTQVTLNAGTQYCLEFSAPPGDAYMFHAMEQGGSGDLFSCETIFCDGYAQESDTNGSNWNDWPTWGTPSKNADLAFFLRVVDGSDTPIITPPDDIGSSTYEDAEDGNTLGWKIYDADPTGADISNLYDTVRDSRVISLKGSSTDNGYRLSNADGSTWQNSEQFVIEWSMQFSESYTVFIDVQTTDGHKFLSYKPDDNDRLGTGEYIYHGLGTSSINGLWQTFTRDLQADLEEAQPGVVIEEVNGFLIRGSGRLDDVKLLNTENAGPLAIETASLSTGLLSVPYNAFIQVSGGKAPYNWTLSNGSLPTGLTLNSATGEISGIPDALGSSTFNVTVADDSQGSINASFTMEVDSGPIDTGVIYENAEDGDTLGWRIYTGNSAGANISNEYDTDWGSQVIVLSGSGQDHGYRLDNADGSIWYNREQFVLQWSMQYSESYTVYIDVQTTDGHKYLYYRPDYNSRLGTDEYIHHGLGTSSINGQWQTFTRDLQADLEEAQPGVVIEEVNGFLIRGSGRLDDVKLLNAESVRR
ncbi:putative Ig domain-containing protein [Moritella sp. 24]|uniref:Ig domain-containing protein n=1 Tax=Moritella sp. 24 TaxID=2746230 RepID=UPI001BAC2C4D|nr:Ig domain-containing protein [Moritella sp. 24]QUM75963.1 putative Ig domain-containing protein [Moritella sp. 24]